MPCSASESKCWLTQPPECGATPSEGVEGDEWGAYVTLLRTTGTNAGSPVGRESYGDGGLVGVDRLIEAMPATMRSPESIDFAADGTVIVGPEFDRL